MRLMRARAIRFVKAMGIFLAIFGGFYGLLNLSWLGPWSLEPLYWRPHLTYGNSPCELYVSVRTPVACRLQVKYQANISGTWGSEQTVTEVDPAFIHNILLSGLVPGQALRYHLELTAESQGLSPAIGSDLAREFIIPSFALFDAAPRPFRFVAFGDVRPTVFGSDNHAAMTAAVRAQNPDFVLHVGDFVQEGSQLFEWARVFTTGEVLFRSIPIVPTPGNHEYGGTDEYSAQTYRDAFRLPGNESYYAYNVSNAHIISIDFASGSGARNATVQAAQMQWLDAHLASLDRSVFDWCFLLFHYPIIASGETHEGIWDTYLGPVFAKYGVAIDVMFHGHVHEYERIYLPKANATSIVTGGGGSEIDPVHLGDMAGQVLELSHSFCMVGVDGLSLTLQGIFMKGGVFDTFTLQTDGGIFA